jgi:hypothetical protein
LGRYSLSFLEAPCPSPPSASPALHPLPLPSPPQRYLSEDLDAWESFGGTHNGKGARVCPAPFAPVPTAGRPIMLDTAAAGIEYPSLEHRARGKAAAAGAAQGSTFARFFGWGGAAS